VKHTTFFKQPFCCLYINVFLLYCIKSNARDKIVIYSTPAKPLASITPQYPIKIRHISHDVPPYATISRHHASVRFIPHAQSSITNSTRGSQSIHVTSNTSSTAVWYTLLSSACELNSILKGWNFHTKVPLNFEACA
jgi:hypothetical protein